MNKLAILFCALVTINAMKYSPDDAFAFTKGFLQGIEANSAKASACVTALDNYLVDRHTIMEDIYSLVEGKSGAFSKLLVDLKESESYLAPVKANCVFSGLGTKIFELLTPSGIETLIKRYAENLKQIKESISVLKVCSSNYQTCGLNAGTIFKLLVGWSLTVPEIEEKIKVPSSGRLAILQGIAAGLQANPTVGSQCFTEFDKFFENADIVVKDLQKVLGGDTNAIINLYNEASKLIKNKPNFCEICGFDGLYEQIKKLMGPQGFMTLLHNFQANKESINQDILAMTLCDENYYKCGEGIGNAFRLLVGWSI